MATFEEQQALQQLLQLVTPVDQAIPTVTGQPFGADTTGGVERVNANTGNTGIRAVRDAAGNITLTNLIGPADTVNQYKGTNAQTIQRGGESYDASGMPLDKTGNPLPVTAEQRAVDTSIYGLLKTLRSTNDGDVARGILAQATTSMAEEQARMFANAQRFASNKLQVPTAEQRLLASEQNDAAMPGYVPGMESAATKSLRSQLGTLRGQVENEASAYLRSNVGYNSLLAAGKNLEQEAQRISRMGDRKEQFEFQRSLIDEQRRASKQEQLEQQAQGLTQEQKNRVKVLHSDDPSFAEADDAKIAATIKQHLTRNDGYTAAIDAPEEALTSLSVNGNSYATSILTAKEEAAGVAPEVTRMRLREVRTIMNDDKALRTGIALLSGSRDKKSVDAQLLNLRTLTAPGASKEQKQQAADMRLMAARAVLDQKITSQFTSNTMAWPVADPAVQKAITDTQNTVGRSDMKSVLTTYLGNTTGVERRRLTDLFTAQAMQAANKTSGSLLGSVDPNKIKLAIQSTETQAVLTRALDSVGASASLNDILYRP